MLKVFRNRRLLIGALVVAALLAFALWPRATAVDVAAITTGPLVVTIDEEGETRVRDRFVVTSPVAGELRRVELEPGDSVARGQTILMVRPAPPTPLDARARAEATAAVAAGEATLGRMRAQREGAATAFARAQQRVERLRRVFSAGGVAQDELDAREADARNAAEMLHAAEFAVAQAQHDLDAARARLMDGAAGRNTRDVAVVAPIDGVVLRRHRESQTVVPAGEALLEIGDPRHLEIVADLLSSDAVRAKPGAAVLIEQWGGEEALSGRIRRVEPSGFTKVSALGVEEQRVNLVIDFGDAEAAWHALGDGYRVEVRVVVWQEQNVVKVPLGALFRRGDEWAVFVSDGGRARLRTVKIGPRNAAEAQVLDGLAEGEEVVLYPPDMLEDGARVTRRPV
jgi:HlyD family secretion protein